jgi:hypothetical protein
MGNMEKSRRSVINGISGTVVSSVIVGEISQVAEADLNNVISTRGLAEDISVIDNSGSNSPIIVKAKPAAIEDKHSKDQVQEIKKEFGKSESKAGVPASDHIGENPPIVDQLPIQDGEYIIQASQDSKSDSVKISVQKNGIPDWSQFVVTSDDEGIKISLEMI